MLTVAAAEAAIGLAILVCFFRNRGTIDVEDVNVMKGNEHGNRSFFAPLHRGIDCWFWLARSIGEKPPSGDHGLFFLAAFAELGCFP